MRIRSGNLQGTTALVVALAALTVAVFAFAYHREVAPAKAGTEAANAAFVQASGLDNGTVQHGLDKRYADADADLVADPPADPAKQLDPPTITFSYVTIEDDDKFKPAFKELMAALGRATGKPVEYRAYLSTADELRDLRDGKLTVTGVTTGSVPLAVCAAGFVPLCQPADAAGHAESHMKVIVPSGSPLASLGDLRGHDLTVTEPNSNSGYKAPLVVLREMGMLPQRDYTIRYSLGHIQSIAAIKARTAEAAAVAGDVLDRETNAGHIAATDYKVIYTSDQTFPGAALGVPYNLKPELAAKIRDVLLSFDWKGTGLETLFAPEGKTKFVPVNYKKDFDYVRRIDDAIGYAYSLGGPAGAPTRPAAH